MTDTATSSLSAPLFAEQDDIALAMLRACAADETLPGVPDAPAGEPRGPFQMRPFFGDRYDWFAAGDVHGDLPALVACADAAIAQARPDRTPILAILGDLVDRGDDSLACMLFVMRLALGRDKARPELKVLFVRGDHDEAVRYDEATGEISSGVRPAELAEHFQGPAGFFARESAVVHAFVRFVAKCPAAVYLDNGTLLFHGGVPQTDVLPRLGLDLSLQSAECAQDFAWCRIEDGVRRKRPSRALKTSEEGSENVQAFLEWFNERLAAAEADPERTASLRAAGFAPLRPVAQIVRGHTHVSEGYLRYRKYPVPLHTVNSFHGDMPLAKPVRPALVALREDVAAAFEPLWPEDLKGLPTLSTEQVARRPREATPVPEEPPANAVSDNAKSFGYRRILQWAREHAKTVWNRLDALVRSGMECLRARIQATSAALASVGRDLWDRCCRSAVGTSASVGRERRACQEPNAQDTTMETPAK